jgi:peptidoglycan/LPS O-acetylase OafA/YrhL
MPQLDGLRAIAVGAVVAQHFQVVRTGAAYGVHLFFVLSGFLITGILLGSRKGAAVAGVGRRHAIRQFYIRRVLRIFPLYYAVVLGGILVNADYAREYAPWLLTYTINLKMAAQGWFIDNFAHFWSLAVEEQYYLLWPWLMLFLPRRWLLPAALTMTAIGPLFRLYLAIQWRDPTSTIPVLQAYIGTPTALDSLGIGSLISILMSSEVGRKRIRSLMRIAVPSIGLGLSYLIGFVLGGPWSIVLYDTATAIFFGWVIYRASTGFGGPIGWFLSLAPLVFVGRISYGVYVYHALVPEIARSLDENLGVPLPAGLWQKFAFYSTITLVISVISWYALERPMIGLKRRFAYVPPGRADVRATAPIPKPG